MIAYWFCRFRCRLALCCVALSLALSFPAVAAPAPIQVARGQGSILHLPGVADSVFIADDSVADIKVVSPSVVYVYGKKIGKTNMVSLDADQRLIGNLPLEVVADTATDETGDVTLSVHGSRLHGEGKTDSVSQAVLAQGALDEGSAIAPAPPLNMTTYSGATQVNIRMRFVEASRSELLAYGVNWNALVGSGNFSFGLVTQGITGGGASNVISGGYSAGNTNIDVLLDAMESNGILRILAEPNITAVNGQQASFLAGGEVPVPVPVNNEMVGISYKPYGVSLQFTPQLLPNNRISMDVTPEVSSVSTTNAMQISGYNVPSFQVRRAHTRVEVSSGQTFAIAGLFQRNNTTNLEQIPLLGRIPVIGPLFQSRRFSNDETELVILITPYLIKPPVASAPATPLDTASAVRAAATQVKQEFGFYVE
ncbi:type II and III secretion system protein family protein [Klebsiella aerogenes]|uniref:type II and III secretion system protein family protein n=1 Tax=Klebsiella aerogenes TaxID=548 RepID=UPI0024336017|nr:type II and III secretion system protein family protein [Klebsiella aerogenes]WFW02018.1 type II and III secretion system protein family protein [Klebsiella aerogenes]